MWFVELLREMHPAPTLDRREPWAIHADLAVYAVSVFSALWLAFVLLRLLYSTVSFLYTKFRKYGLGAVNINFSIQDSALGPPLRSPTPGKDE